MLSVGELEDFLELGNPKIIKQIAASKKDYDAGRVRNARDLLSELKSARATKGKRQRVQKWIQEK